MAFRWWADSGSRLFAGWEHNLLQYYIMFSVPQYHYASPQPIDRRRRYSDDRSDLEYHVDIFGERTHLVLEENKELIAPGTWLCSQDKHFSLA